MKATELRIGNYLQDAKGRLATVEGLSKNKIKAYSGVITTMPLKPIPLTEEWLLKFWFEKCEGRHGEYFKHREFDAFRVWYNEDLRSWSVGRKDYESVDRDYNTYWIRDLVKTVHLLQNIFYCLIGEELTIKQTESI